MRAAAKPGIHPEMQSAPVICNGEEVYTVTGTDAKYVVDLWSGNHPFYNGVKTTLVLDEGQVPPPASPCHASSLYVTPACHASMSRLVTPPCHAPVSRLYVMRIRHASSPSCRASTSCLCVAPLWHVSMSRLHTRPSDKLVRGTALGAERWVVPLQTPAPGCRLLG